MTGVGRSYGHPVHVTLLVIEHSLGPDHASDRVDGEDIVAVRVSICSEKRSQIVWTEILKEIDGRNCAWVIILAVTNLNTGEHAI